MTFCQNSWSNWFSVQKIQSALIDLPSDAGCVRIGLLQQFGLYYAVKIRLNSAVGICFYHSEREREREREKEREREREL